MAGSAQDHHRGEQDISEQRSTYAMFMGLTKWGSLIVAASLLFLSIAFATEAGFLAAAFFTAIVLVVGWFGLRSKPGSH
jgi:hypothetical protein